MRRKHASFSRFRALSGGNKTPVDVMKTQIASTFAALSLLTLAAPAQSQDCSDVTPNLAARQITPISGPSACLDSETALSVVLEAERVCYATGLSDSEQTADLPEPRERTIRVRRGMDVKEVRVVSSAPLRDSTDIRVSLDTVQVQMTGTLCVGADTARFASGRWRIAGRDAGSAFSATGYFPSGPISAAMEQGTGALQVQFDLQGVQLYEDPKPRRIAGALPVPLP